MNVIIFYEHIVREWDAVQRLKSLYEKSGDRAETFSISFEEAKRYRRQFLNLLTRESQWEEIIVNVYL